MCTNFAQEILIGPEFDTWALINNEIHEVAYTFPASEGKLILIVQPIYGEDGVLDRLQDMISAKCGDDWSWVGDYDHLLNYVFPSGLTGQEILHKMVMDDIDRRYDEITHS